MTPRRVVDAVGTRCPVPVHLLARALRRVPPGALVELLADDPLVAVDVPAWCHSAGATVEAGGREPDGVYRFVVRAPEPPPAASPGAHAPR